MGDYNINYLNELEQQNLVTILIPYGLQIINTKIHTRIHGISRSLIDYIISDHFNAEVLQRRTLR